MERRAISIRGLVQGVGFRPYVFTLAKRHGLSGFVVNETDGVRIEVEGGTEALDRFVVELPRSAPEAARIETLTWNPTAAVGDVGFRIEMSAGSDGAQPMVLADRATCDDCVRELFDPRDRRFRYPFLNCTQCGPRLTIIEGAPYDRERTTMAKFAMCPDCRREYEDPSDRRFHAQPTACPVCGPRLSLLASDGASIDADNPLGDFVRTILAGGIGALKGLGGYHLVANAVSEEAVAQLRARKRRYEKPFAVMVSDLERVRELAELNEAEQALLTSVKRPIVLLRKKTGTALAESVAPGNPYVGLMLPYTPLHFLLLHDVEGVPLVMTSGNRSDEPIVHRDEDVSSRLVGIADVVLGHDRPIRVRADDSVSRIALGEELVVRRSRGYAPEPLTLARPLPGKILAVGAQWKNTFAFGSGTHAFLSHHIGDLEDQLAFEAFERDLKLYEELFDFRPEWIVHDLHPDYASTRYAVSRAEREGLQRMAVQHHHAHIASCLAERGLDGSVIGVAFDGTGFGPDGTIWGGEFLVCDRKDFLRAACLLPVPLPGGDAAAREPWRMALSYLLSCELPYADLVRQRGAEVVEQMLRKRFNSPMTSSAGRLFDAVASLVGVRQTTTYEGQAAMELEWLCGERAENGTYPYALLPHQDGFLVDTRPLVAAIAGAVRAGTDPSDIARRFHSTMASLIVDVAVRLRDQNELERVVLSGGVFQNRLLTALLVDRLERRGFRVFRHRQVPPNDGGLCLGQLAIAGARMESETPSIS